MAYTLLYRVKHKVGYDKRLSSWLVLPRINKHLKAALSHYGIELQAIEAGFWQANTLFPLYVVAYNDLPFELPYSELKLFVKSGQALQKLLREVLESEQWGWIAEMLRTAELIHPEDLEEVLSDMGLTAQRASLRKKMLEMVAEDIQEIRLEGKREGKLETQRKTAYQMKADGMPTDQISRYTGLSTKEIDAL